VATIQRFEDIEAWAAARKLTQAVYMATSKNSFSRDFPLRDQIRRAAISTMANIAEGFGRGGNREFIQFLAHAKASAVEVQSHLYVALDAGYIDEDSFKQLYEHVEKTASLIAGLARYLSSSNLKGTKFKPQTQNAKRGTEKNDIT